MSYILFRTTNLQAIGNKAVLSGNVGRPEAGMMPIHAQIRSCKSN
jgi:predicted molibdopterin-dependent oxidoreductase YjgC